MLKALATPLTKFCTSRHSVSLILDETGRTNAKSVAIWQAMNEKTKTKKQGSICFYPPTTETRESRLSDSKRQPGTTTKEPNGASSFCRTGHRLCEYPLQYDRYDWPNFSLTYELVSIRLKKRLNPNHK